MSLSQKYEGVVDRAQKLGIKDLKTAEVGGQFQIGGTAPYRMEKDLLWDAIKKQANWEAEIVADIRVEKDDIFGMWTVQPGDSLSKIAKSVYDDGQRYMAIFEANRNILKDPDKIQVGQKLVIPNV